MRFYDIGESPLMGYSEKHVVPLVLGGIIAAGASLAGNVSGSIGYNLRYWQWKSNIDTVHAGFRTGAAYQSWVAPLDGWHVLTSDGAWSYQSMKVRPNS